MAALWRKYISMLEEQALQESTVAPNEIPAVDLGPQQTPSRLHPKIRVYANADFSTTGFAASSLNGHPNVDVIAHAYYSNTSTPTSIATEIADYFEAFDYIRGRGDAGGGLYMGSFIIQNEATGTYSGSDRTDGLFISPDDLLVSSWGDPTDTVGGSPDDFTPLCKNARDLLQARSIATAVELKRILDERTLCYPSRKIDDYEFKGNSFPSFETACAFDTSEHSGLSGWMLPANFPSEGTYTDVTNWAICAGANAQRTNPIPVVGLSDTKAWSDVFADAPAYTPTLKWSNATNQAFSNWLASRFTEAMSASLRFGPEYGYRREFPELKCCNYATSLVTTLDAGYPHFGGTNDYTWVRQTTRSDYIWQDYSSPVLYGGDATGRILVGESYSDFYRRFNIEKLIACRITASLPVIPWTLGPGTTITIQRSGSVPYTVTTEDFLVIAKACLLLNNTEIIVFAPGAPYPNWSALDTSLDQLLRWSRSFFAGGRRGSRIISLSR